METRPVDGFRLAYDRAGEGPPVVLLHGWPGDRTDFDRLVPLLTARADVVVPDLRGFGASDRHEPHAADAYAAPAQARSVAGLIEELGLVRPVVAGYDIGSRIAQGLAQSRPELVGHLVVAPPLPGIGTRILTPEAQREFWYQPFHQLPLADRLVDGDPEAVRTYLAHFWEHWSGPDHQVEQDRLDHLVETYARPGAFTASIAWYRAGAGAVAVSVAEESATPAVVATPTTVLWPEHDPLFPRAWSDRLATYFAAVRLRPVDGVGHFAPVEYPGVLAEEILSALSALDA